jgi:hypothetical protein
VKEIHPRQSDHRHGYRRKSGKLHIVNVGKTVAERRGDPCPKCGRYPECLCKSIPCVPNY